MTDKAYSKIYKAIHHKFINVHLDNGMIVTEFYFCEQGLVEKISQVGNVTGKELAIVGGDGYKIAVSRIKQITFPKK
jgi:hypothetical protein